ncbi:uncharacterized protein LOC120942948 [Rana temporaria]|uniref:uncharacterized protein LOC120942948 n=1 Tax=Rana temporaria TaxID=8407 RepID=UPI001AAD0E90|nr:uncharacterized protein LOC120942948 [Rana temporaria]
MDTEAGIKINLMRQRMDQSYAEKKKGKTSPGYVIGMLTTLQQSDIAWIDAELRRGGEHIKEIKYVNVSNIKTKDFDKALSDSTFCLYILTEQKWKTILSPTERKKALASFGKKKPIVLIVDMIDSSDEEKNRIIKDQPKIKDYMMDLFLFKRIEEKSEIPQDSGIGQGSTSFQGGSLENKLPEENLDQHRNPYHLPQPAAKGGSLERNVPGENLDQYKHLPYRLPQPADSGGFQNQLPAPKPDQYRTPSYRLPKPAGAGLHTETTQRSLDRKHTVGIFSRSREQDYAWLVRLLKEVFQDVVGDVKCCSVSNNGQQQLMDDLSQCTFGILYHTKNRGRVNITDVEEALYDEELETISAELGRRNIIVVVDDLEEDMSSELEKTLILRAQPRINKLACELFLISVPEKANTLILSTKLKPLKFIFEGDYASLKIQNTGSPDHHSHPPSPRPVPPYPENGAGDNHPPNLHPVPPYTENGAGNASPVQSRERIPSAATVSSKSTVAIFSKSEESDYAWLSLQLSSIGLDVRSYKISSSNQPQETAFQCKLVILYHNMHDGKLRLTDAKDAMYHEELEMLSIKFGKRRVIVVIDDLVDSDDKIKSQVLERQPSTGRFARDLFLFSMKEKKTPQP